MATEKHIELLAARYNLPLFVVEQVAATFKTLKGVILALEEIATDELVFRG